MVVEPVLSCSDKAQDGLVDTCCAETYGGLVVRTCLFPPAVCLSGLSALAGWLTD